MLRFRNRFLFLLLVLLKDIGKLILNLSLFFGDVIFFELFFDGLGLFFKFRFLLRFR